MSIESLVHCLRGYLYALRDMNDDRENNRFAFTAYTLELKEDSIISSVKSYLKDPDLKLTPMNVDEFIMNQEYFLGNHIFNNFMLGEVDISSPKLKEMKRNIIERVIDYFIFMKDQCKEFEAWFVEPSEEPGREKCYSIYRFDNEYLLLYLDSPA